MLRKILVRLALLVGGGTLSLMFLMIAQVNLDDLRLVTGEQRIVSDPVLRVGGFYTILPNGRTVGPHCVLKPKVLERYYTESASSVRISNQLGSSLPIISRWTANLLGWVGVSEVALKPKDVGNAATFNWTGHTLDASPVKLHSLTSTSAVWQIIDESYKLDPACEKEVSNRARSGSCVTIVYRISQVAGQKIGYQLASQHCIIANGMDPITVPRRPARLTAWLSQTKNRLGLLDHSIAISELSVQATPPPLPAPTS